MLHPLHTHTHTTARHALDLTQVSFTLFRASIIWLSSCCWFDLLGCWKAIFDNLGHTKFKIFPSNTLTSGQREYSSMSAKMTFPLGNGPHKSMCITSQGLLGVIVGCIWGGLYGCDVAVQHIYTRFYKVFNISVHSSSRISS